MLRYLSFSILIILSSAAWASCPDAGLLKPSEPSAEVLCQESRDKTNANQPCNQKPAPVPQAITWELPSNLKANKPFTILVHFELPVSCYNVWVRRESEANVIHYIDYGLVKTGSHCPPYSTIRTVPVKFKHLPAGRHTLSVFGPDGTEIRTMFHIPAESSKTNAENSYRHPAYGDA